MSKNLEVQKNVEVDYLNLESLYTVEKFRKIKDKRARTQGRETLGCFVFFLILATSVLSYATFDRLEKAGEFEPLVFTPVSKANEDNNLFLNQDVSKLSIVEMLTLVDFVKSELLFLSDREYPILKSSEVKESEKRILIKNYSKAEISKEKANLVRNFTTNIMKASQSQINVELNTKSEKIPRVELIKHNMSRLQESLIELDILVGSDEALKHTNILRKSVAEVDIGADSSWLLRSTDFLSKSNNALDKKGMAGYKWNDEEVRMYDRLAIFNGDFHDVYGDIEKEKIYSDMLKERNLQ